MNAMTQSYLSEHDDFRVVWVAVEEDLQQAWEFMDAYQISEPCIVDVEGSLYRSYGPGQTDVRVPMNVVIDRNGVVTYLAFGTDLDDIAVAIDAAISGNSPMQTNSSSSSHPSSSSGPG